MSCSWDPWSAFHTISSAGHVVHDYVHSQLQLFVSCLATCVQTYTDRDYVHSQLQLFVSCLANCVQTCTDRTASEACFHVYRENSPLANFGSFDTACVALGMNEIER